MGSLPFLRCRQYEPPQRCMWACLAASCLIVAFAADTAVYSSEAAVNGLNPKLSDKLQRGKQQFDEIEQRGQQSSCWANVLSQLPVGCSKMGEDARARMAVRLANCQFEQSGLPTYDC